MTRKRLILLAAALLLLAGGWYFGAPYWTLWQMREAAEARDSERLARYIDFAALRASSKAQLRAQLAAEAAAGRGGGDEMRAFGAVIGMAMIDPVVDRLVTPEAMRLAFDRVPERSEAGGGGADPAGSGQTEPMRAPFGIDAADVTVVRTGFGEFRLRRRGSDGEAGDLVFRRHGLGWKLEEIRLPPDLMARQGRF